MELDEFKQLYKEKNAVETVSHSANELEAYLRKNTHSITGKIKRSIWFEAVLSILLFAVSVWAWFIYPARFVRVFSMLTIFLCCIFLICLAALYKKIIAFEHATPAIKTSLRQLIAILQQFTRLYFQFTMVTLPIAFIFGLITGYLDVSGNTALKNFNWLRGILFYTGWFLLWSAIMYFFTRWYIRKLYGNYLLQLQQQLKDIENG